MTRTTSAPAKRQIECCKSSNFMRSPFKRRTPSHNSGSTVLRTPDGWPWQTRNAMTSLHVPLQLFTASLPLHAAGRVVLPTAGMHCRALEATATGEVV